MRKTVPLAVCMLFWALLNGFAGMENSLPTAPERPLFKNSNLFMKNQLIMSYATSGKNSYFQNSWLGAFSYKVSPLTTMTFNMSVNKLDGSLFNGLGSQPFPLYSVQMDHKKNNYSYGIRFGNSGMMPYLVEGASFFSSMKVPMRVDGYMEKTFMEGTVSLSLYGSTILSR